MRTIVGQISDNRRVFSYSALRTGRPNPYHIFERDNKSVSYQEKTTRKRQFHSNLAVANLKKGTSNNNTSRASTDQPYRSLAYITSAQHTRHRIRTIRTGTIIIRAPDEFELIVIIRLAKFDHTNII